MGGNYQLLVVEREHFASKYIVISSLPQVAGTWESSWQTSLFSLLQVEDQGIHVPSAH